MSVNLYNAERYLDPTAYEALMNIEREAKRTAYKPLVYICSPFSGNTERNAERARGFCRFAVTENCIPLAPHLLFPQFMDEDDPAQRRLGIFFGLVLQSKCKEMWVFGGMAPWKVPIKSWRTSAMGCRSSSFSRTGTHLAPATIPAPSGQSTPSGKSSGAPGTSCKEGRS